MDLTLLKARIHELVDSQQNTGLLQSLLDYLQHQPTAPSPFWKSLSASQQADILAAFDGSEREDELLPVEALFGPTP
jgi:hypothetical protein